MSTRVSRVWLEVSALNVHSVCDELLIHPHYIDQCKEMLGLVFSNISTSRYYSTTKLSMPSWFTTTQEKDRNSIRNMDLQMFAMISSMLFLFHSHYAQPKGYPLRFLTPIQVYELPIGFSNKLSTKPLQMQFFICF